MKTRLFKKIRYRLVGDKGLLVEFGEGIDPSVNQEVHAMVKNLTANKPNGITDIIPAYRSVLISYDPQLMNPYMIEYFLHQLRVGIKEGDISPSTIVEIPVCYGGEYGPDIENVARHNDITIDDVIETHCKPEYLIYMTGFTPGFPFLGGLPENLTTPRLETPRLKVPKGSVGIANNQTGIYPIESPGGWQLIGRTPLNLFDPSRANPLLYKAGDSIRFIPVTKNEYKDILNKGDF